MWWINEIIFESLGSLFSKKIGSIDESQARMGSKLLQNLEENRCYQHSNVIKPWKQICNFNVSNSFFSLYPQYT